MFTPKSNLNKKYQTESKEVSIVAVGKDQVIADNNKFWRCYNCDENDNCITKNSFCKSCNLGINPLYYFNLNEHDPSGYSFPILKKEFGLIKGKIVNFKPGKHCQVCFVICNNFF